MYIIRSPTCKRTLLGYIRQSLMQAGDSRGSDNGHDAALSLLARTSDENGSRGYVYSL